MGLRLVPYHLLAVLLHDTGYLRRETDTERIIGLGLATADLMGQMSADDYVDRLPQLYSEFRESWEYLSDPHPDGENEYLSRIEANIRKTVRIAGQQPPEADLLPAALQAWRSRPSRTGMDRLRMALRVSTINFPWAANRA